MITAVEKQMRLALKREVRKRIHEKLTFSGSEKLKIKIVIVETKASLVFDGPSDVVMEAKKRWDA